MSPTRRCLGCRERDDQSHLLRFVAAAGTVSVDRARRLPGRGGYVHPTAACLDQAVRRKAFGRALRAEVDPVRAAEALRPHLQPLA